MSEKPETTDAAAPPPEEDGIFSKFRCVVIGLVLAGDSLDGLGRPEEALQSFSAAFDAYSVHLEAAGGELEPPRYIATRIVQLQEQLGQRIQRSPQ